MPPPKSNKTLDARQKEILKRWIEQGAEYQQHWSYEKPVKAADPRRAERRRRAGPAAARRDRAEAIARGRPPHPDPPAVFRPDRPAADPEEVAAFVEDKSPDAYERLVDRLLASPHYGERMAIGWLDVVRFADTIGYHSDNPRNVWPYRDWVIKSFNDNKPFDRFTLEQIAGDLLPDANTETRVGSAFNRLLLTTEEGGAQPKDYEARMLTDRVRAIGAAWLGQTTGCAQCHDHKFDPIHDAGLLLARRVLRRHQGAHHRPPRGRDGRCLARAADRTSQGSMPPSPRRRSDLEPSSPSSTPPSSSGRRTCPATPSRCPSWPGTRRRPPAEKTGRAGRPSGAEEGREGAQPEGDARRCRPISARKPRRCSRPSASALARAERERQEFADGLPKCLVSVRSATRGPCASCRAATG